ncbi:hypothetical protein TanjilG_27809 [Lupinus angustifolius]|uniref:RING-type domain-containing protein n=1 Tax=Lupinus angustifolius TaxID=3871 RepID=A0A4P1RHU2_LUPAN|nr:PREDICTED: BOI-related E3 ubiquitin-protein ligase 1-like isoform X2 [Lupinus angustifolius]OIW10863.1 hypothetical protein TanjilG_27809 [Lupinus angustifolius]
MLMSVQAQYPSNVFLLSSGKSVQEGHDYSLQPQSGLNQSHMLFNNGATSSSRKRGREEAATTGVSQTVPNPLFSVQLQSQTPQLIDLTQIHNHNHNHQQNAVSTGLGLSFGDQQKQLHNQQQLSLFSEGLNSQIKQQRDEVEQFLQVQGEQLRQTLADMRERHYRSLLNAVDESVARRLREKQTDMEKATRRNAELEARAAQLIVEAQVWQAKVKAQESTAASLQAQLHHAIMMSHEKRVVEDGGVLSCAVGHAEDAESAHVDPGRVTVSGPSCSGCDLRVASVVVLPCRHLCVCTECDMHFRACPVCLTVKNSSIQVCLS